MISLTQEWTFYWGLSVALAVVGAMSALFLTWMNAPYGRFGSSAWGPQVSSRLGWLIMEIPASLGMVLWFCLGNRQANTMAWLFLGLWQVHYLYRGMIFPFTRRGGQKPMPLAVVLMGLSFNLVNTYLIGRWLFYLGPELSTSWLLDPRFVLGLAVFVGGLVINRQSDRILRQLRAPGETGYKIPHGGLYRWISAPNYLGELIEWSGWALLTWSPGSLAFAFFTAANLVPRALAIHRWYRREFPDYPPERRALVPRLW
jgi:protein-S-isoprenylcysteine O-methyltransferase Ste14